MRFTQIIEPPERRRPWWKGWKDTRLIWALAALSLTVLVMATVLGYWQRWAWTDLLWRWLELLIIPIVLGAGAFWFNSHTRKSEQEIARRERENEQAIAKDRRREEALQRYLDTMQELILDKGLRRSEKDAEIRDVARARTLTVLRSLDGERKGQVVRFLHEADLIGKAVTEASGETRVIEAIIDLHAADLTHADLFAANLTGADLTHANLGATLRFTYTGADPSEVTREAIRVLVSNEQLAHARSLFGATMPDGTVMTHEGWEEFKKSYRQ
jgi:hypothetical protein